MSQSSSKKSVKNSNPSLVERWNKERANDFVVVKKKGVAVKQKKK